jgi:hypothetical protein
MAPLCKPFFVIDTLSDTLLCNLVDRTSFAPLKIIWADELDWATPIFREGLFFRLSGLRNDILVVVKTPRITGRKPCLASKPEKPVR